MYSKQILGPSHNYSKKNTKNSDDYHKHSKLGRNLNSKNLLKICYYTNFWTVDVKPMDNNTRQEHFYIKDTPSVQQDSERLSNILDAKYKKADLQEITANITNLNKLEQKQLKQLLTDNESLFDGTLGQWTGEPYKIQLQDNVDPYHAKPFPVPHAYEATLKTEVERLVKIGVLKKVNQSEWAAPSFIIPKKDKTV